jgi:hypothetical protein
MQASLLIWTSTVTPFSRLTWHTCPSSVGTAHLYPAVLRVAHRCWSGEQPFITRADLMAEVEQDLAIAPDVKAQVFTALNHFS